MNATVTTGEQFANDSCVRELAHITVDLATDDLSFWRNVYLVGNASVAEQNQVFANALAAGGQSNWSAYDGC